MSCIAGAWRPKCSTALILKPTPGLDVVTTLDINLQDVAENRPAPGADATTRAAYGTVILMEVKTGEIKALANLGRKKINGEERVCGRLQLRDAPTRA